MYKMRCHGNDQEMIIKDAVSVNYGLYLSITLPGNVGPFGAEASFLGGGGGSGGQSPLQ